MTSNSDTGPSVPGDNGAPQGPNRPERREIVAGAAHRGDQAPLAKPTRAIDTELANFPQPTSAEEFAAFNKLATGAVVIQFIHRDQRQLEGAARKRGVDPHEDPACAHLYIEFGNARFFPRPRRDKLTLRGWLGRADSEEWNTYFFLPATRRRPVGAGSRPNSKPRKDHIKGVRILWVDLDPEAPPAGCTDLAAWNESQRAAILDRLRQFRPAPSFIIDSGGGYQAFWILREEFAVDPEVRLANDDIREYLVDGAWTRDRALAEAWRDKRIAEIECHLGALCEQLGGDHGTWNVERVMRMPFTWNNVDADKAARKGRVRRPTGLVEWHPERQYSIEEMPRTSEHPSLRGRDSTAGSDAGPVAVSASGDLAGKRFAPHQLPLVKLLESFQPHPRFSLDDIEGARLSEETLFVLRVGCARKDAVPGDGDALVRPPGTDRNRECVRFAGMALRDGLQPQQVANLLMHPDYAVAGHVRDQADPARAAKRAVATAIQDMEKPRPEVRLPGGAQDNLSFVRDMLPLLRGAGFYSRGGAILRVANGAIDLIDSASAVTEFEELASFHVLERTADGPRKVRKVLKESVAKLALRSRELRHGLPEIKVFSKCPLLLRDGRILTGYDPETKVFAHGVAPPLMSVGDALVLLRDLLCDFRFATPEDEARAIVALLIPLFCFGKLLGPEARYPMLVMEADQSQTGKGTFLAVQAAIYGQEASIITVDAGLGGVGSFKEQIADRLIRAVPFVQADNVRGKAETSYLESLLTERNVNCRVPYGGNAEVDPRCTCFSMTSNKAEFTIDLANRSLIVQLRKQPADHVWREWPEGGLIEHVKANQARYLGALFAIGRASIDAGCPSLGPGGHAFRDWAGSARWIAMHLLGLPDPMKGVRVAQERVSSPHLNWARDVALVVQAAGMLDRELKAHDLLELLVEAGADVPGVAIEELDDADGQRKALMGIGRRLAILFRTREVIEIDGLWIRRRESDAPNVHGHRERSYIVTARAPDQAAPPDPVDPELPF